MGILDGIKDRVLRRSQDTELDDFRSHVLGQAQFEPPVPEPQPPKKSYERDPVPDEMEPFGFDKSIVKEKDTLEVSKNYEIMDRLNIIEAQLSAIRSQTETINERLKNIDMRMQGRRY